MPSTLYEIIIEHHVQARLMAEKTFRCRKDDPTYPSGLDELRKVGNKFTTKVEKRLRKIDVNHFGKTKVIVHTD